MATPTPSSLASGGKIAVILLLTFATAVIDYLSGSEIRVYPLYFLPIALGATWIGPRFGVFMAALCAVLWYISNALGMADYSSQWIWAWNTVVQFLAFLFISVLISSLQAARLRERGSARLDKLTGLPNLRAFRERAPALISLCRRDASPLVVAYIDLDNFKEVNDTEGHARGDDILCLATRVMQAGLRTSDLLCRTGGDEFIAILPKASPEAARDTLERLRQAIETAMRGDGTHVTASIGAVACTCPPQDLDELVRSADQAMYAVKKSGKNRIIVTPFAA